MVQKEVTIILWFLLPMVLCCCPCSCQFGQEIKGMFVFGSSLVDNGNNNFLPNSRAKADYLPYGIDFPSGPSGRFTNGKNVIDLLCDHLSLPLVPPFGDPQTKGSKIIHGVNFASGSSGILDDTGLVAVQVINLNQQIRNFEEVTIPELEAEMGCKARKLLRDYLFVVGSGGNDYSFNYFLRAPSNTTNNDTLEAFTTNLTNSLSLQIKKLYSLGARKFVLMSINPLGCNPVSLARQSSGNGCVERLNKAAQLFNSNVRALVDVSHRQLPGSFLVFVNSYKIITDIIQSPTSKGFEDTTNPCCEVVSPNEGGILCKRDGKACEDRSTYVFFDGLHPTEATNVHIATAAFHSVFKSDVYPINVKQLAHIKLLF